MPAKRKPFVKLQCQNCKRINYFTRAPRVKGGKETKVSLTAHKSKKAEKKLELKKFCRWCRKHTLHKETKK